MTPRQTDWIPERQEIAPGSEIGTRLGFTTEIYTPRTLVRNGNVVWLRSPEMNAPRYTPVISVYDLATTITRLGYTFIFDTRGTDPVYRAVLQQHFLRHGGYAIPLVPGDDTEWEVILLPLIPRTLTGSPLHSALEYYKALDESEERLWHAWAHLTSLQKRVVDEFRVAAPDAAIWAVDEEAEIHFEKILTHIRTQRATATELALTGIHMDGGMP